MKKTAVLVFVFMFAASVSFAADNESWIQKIKNKFQKKEVATVKEAKPSKEIAPAKEMKAAAASKKQRKDMTKAELAADITKNLNREESILNMIPGLEKKSGPEGKEYYTYKGTKLEDIDRDTLDKIFGKVRSEALRLRTDKVNRQIETVHRVNAVSQIPKLPIVPQTIVTPPQVPKTAQTTSRPPVTPTIPRR